MPQTVYESDGRAVQVGVSYAISKDDVIYSNGWLGIANDDAVSGDTIAVSIAREEYQFPCGSLTPSIGDTIYVTLASVSAEVVPVGALSLTSGAGKKALCKCTSTRFVGLDGSTYYVTGILLPEGI